MAKVCNCGSHDMKSLKAIREQYNTKTNSTTIGAAIFSGGGVGVGAAKTSGTLAPKIAKDIENRVPKKPGIFSILLWTLITWFFLGVGFQEINNSEDGSFYFIVSAITILIVIVKIIGRKNYNKKYDRFRRTWYCFSCGNFWVYKNRVKGST